MPILLISQEQATIQHRKANIKLINFYDISNVLRTVARIMVLMQNASGSNQQLEVDAYTTI